MQENAEFVPDASLRALRRHHIERLKKYRQKYWGYWRWADGSKMSDRQKGVVVNTPKPCSCWMCCNPRRLNGERTMQEQRANQRRLQETDCTSI